MPKQTTHGISPLATEQPWPLKTELVSLRFDLVTDSAYELYPQYTIGLHAWFLQQIQGFDPALSAQLHDGETDKAFNLFGPEGIGDSLQAIAADLGIPYETAKTYKKLARRALR